MSNFFCLFGSLFINTYIVDFVLTDGLVLVLPVLEDTWVTRGGLCLEEQMMMDQLDHLWMTQRRMKAIAMIKPFFSHYYFLVSSFPTKDIQSSIIIISCRHRLVSVSVKIV